MTRKAERAGISLSQGPRIGLYRPEIFSGLNQAHGCRPVLSNTGCQGAPGGPRADDKHIKMSSTSRQDHRGSLQRSGAAAARDLGPSELIPGDFGVTAFPPPPHEWPSLGALTLLGRYRLEQAPAGTVVRQTDSDTAL